MPYVGLAHGSQPCALAATAAAAAFDDALLCTHLCLSLTSQPSHVLTEGLFSLIPVIPASLKVTSLLMPVCCSYSQAFLG